MNNPAAPKMLWLVLAMVLAFHWTLAWSSASAQGPAAPMMENPTATPEEKKEEAPTTCGPLITDTCVPIEEHHASMQVLWGLSFYPGNFSPNWRYVSAHGDFYTFNMPVKFTYGPTQNLETYIIAPFIVDWGNHVDLGAGGPNGERSASYAGIGDITAVAKYLVLGEEDTRPAVSLVGGGGLAQRPRLEPQPAVPGPGRHRHRVFQLHYWRQPVQMAETALAIQQHLVEQSGQPLYLE